MKKLIYILLFISLGASAQQWQLTNNDLTVDIKKNTGTTISVGKWLMNFLVVGDSVKIIYQRNQDDAHFINFLDKDSVNLPVVASATALYDTLVAWTVNAGPVGPTGPTGATGATGFLDIDSCYTRIQADTIGCGTSLIVDAPSGTTFNGDVSLSGNELFAGTVHVHTRFDIGDLAHDHHLTIGVAEDFTADRILNLFLSDASRNLTIDGDAIISGDNNGDVTLAGTPDYITIAGQVITRNKLDLIDDLNTFSSANLATNLTDETGSGLAVFNNTPFFLDDIVIGTPATATGQALFRGTTSGTVTLSVEDAAGTWTMKLPVDDGDASEFLQTDGSGNTSWQPGGSTLPGGANTNVQYNDGGAFGGEADLTWDETAHTLGIGNAAGTAGNIQLAGDLSFILFNATMGSIQIDGSDMQFENSTSYIFDAPVNLTPTSNQLVFQSTGVTGTLSWTPGTSNKTIKLPNGSTDFTATGGASQVVKQTSAGGALTVGQIAASDLSSGTFADDILQISNPAGTFQYIFSTSAITADRTLTYPLFHQNERIAVEPYTGQTTADRTSASTSLADVADLAAFSTAANTKYYFVFELSVTTNATTVGILLSVNHSTAITSLSFNTMYPISATVNNVQQNLTALDGGVQPTAGNGATIQTAKVWGIVNTNTAGTFALRFASETGAAVTVKAGSTGIVQRVN